MYSYARSTRDKIIHMTLESGLFTVIDIHTLYHIDKGKCSQSWPLCTGTDSIFFSFATQRGTPNEQQSKYDKLCFSSSGTKC